MKRKRIIPFSLITFILLLILTNSTNSQAFNFAQKFNQNDSTLLFDSILNSFKKMGFSVNPKTKKTDLIDDWKDALKFNYTATEALYIVLGNSKGYDPEIFYSNNCWHFDVEAIEGKGSYRRILENIKRISKNDINFQNIKDYCNDREDNKAWVSFNLNGDKYKWNLEVDDDYVDIKLFDKIEELLRKYNKKGRLTYFSEGQSVVFSYFTQEEFEKFNNESGMKIEWLIQAE